MLLNPTTWTLSQAQAAGKHIASYAAGGVTVFVAFGLINHGQGTDAVDAINSIGSGVEQITKGVVTLVGILVPIYTALKAANNASPKSQLNSVVKNLSAPEVTQVANAIADPEGRNKLINAVSEMPEVMKVETTREVAIATPSTKVVPV